jgi:two-component system, NtrC family, sensor kinase
MRRGAKRVTMTVAAGRPIARKSRLLATSTEPALERRLAEALEREAAVSEILRMMSDAPGDVKPMLDAVADRALRLCDASDATIFLLDADRLRAAARFGTSVTPLQEGESMAASRGWVTGRAVVDRATVHVEDLATAPEDEYPIGRELQRRLGHHTCLSVPLLREGRAVGAIALWRMERRCFTDAQIDLVKTFADQAVIAIENVRLFNETKEALEQQIATSDILRVISQSPGDVKPVFDAIAVAAQRLCGGTSANVVTFDGQWIRVAALATVGVQNADAIRHHFDTYPRPPSRDTANTRAVLTRRVVVIPDVLEDRDYKAGPTAVAAGYRSVVSVPLMRVGDPIGAITVARAEPGPFPEHQITLLQTFADQAVIAIENVRLFNETKEALEQQIATSDILRVISQSPRDVQPAFDTIARAALKLCRAGSAYACTFDGELIHLVAFANVRPEGADQLRQVFPRPPSRETTMARAVLTRSVVVIPDVHEDPDYAIQAAARASDYRSVLAVPLLRGTLPIGAIGVARPEPGPFPAKQIALLQTFADQAVIAIENVRLFKELETRTLELARSVGELKALGEVGQAVSSTLDLETVLSTIVSRATQLAGMDGGSIWEYDELREEFYLHATERLPGELVEILRSTPIRRGEGALGRLAMVGEPVEIEDFAHERSYRKELRETLIRCGYRSVLAVPLLRENHLLGALAVNRSSPGGFAPEVTELLKTFATQSALAIQNARLYREIESKSRQLEIASQHKSEFLANMSHELRTPLNAIIGFSEVLSERMFGEINEKQAEYIGDILESGRHLLSLINDILDLSKIEAGRMELELTDFDLASTIESTLILVRERAQRRGIVLGRTVDERLGIIRADERKVKQVLLNLLSNALKFTPEGGRIEVRGAALDGIAEISVTDTGVGIAAADQEAVFEEFRQVGTADKKVEGTGLGLAISRKFIELHGGRIWVKSTVGSGSTFAFTLPLR